jgi:hypothetical protein
MDEQQKKWIDEANYESLLRRWRFAEPGSPWFQGETGNYFAQVFNRKRQEVGDAEHVRASKSVGWDEPIDHRKP